MKCINDLKQSEIEGIIGIGEIGNYYGGLLIVEFEKSFYWGIENYNGTFWEKIEEKLYKGLLKMESK